MSSILHTFTDTSILCCYSARVLSQLPIWKGNRILDAQHVKSIEKGLKSIRDLDSKLYHVAILEMEDGSSEKYIIDGQHRVTVLQSYYNTVNPFDAEEFNVLVVEKKFNSEYAIMSHFGILNKQKSINWNEDPILIANLYLSALMKKLNTDPKKPIIRSGKTRKPYISADALRNELVKKRVGIIYREPPEEYSERIYQEHLEVLDELKMKSQVNSEEKTAIQAQCIFGLIDNWKWIEPNY